MALLPLRPVRCAGIATVLACLLRFQGEASAHPDPPAPRIAPPVTHAAARPAPPPPATPAAPVRPTSANPAIHAGELRMERAAPLTHFGGALDHDTIRASNGFLNDRTFAKKWSSALESPLLFFRSFPSAYYRDLRSVTAHVPGGEGIIMGDPHPENFGFVKTAGGTEFVFNDFDDSGRGPVAVDALRYFVALRLAYPGKPHVFAKALDAYVDAVTHGATVAPPSSVKPQWSEIRGENLKKFTSEHAFVSTKDNRLLPAPASTAASVRSLVEKDGRFGGAAVLDVALRERDHGGSGGLQRIWVLTRQKGEPPRILELKEAGPPATDELAGATLRLGDRIATLKDKFLKSPAQDDLFSVELGGTRFLVRDRSRMASVPIDELSKDERNDLLRAQASVMANVHREGWAGVDEHTMRSWLDASSETLAKRWEKAFDRARE